MTELPKFKKRLLEDGQWPRLFIEHDKHNTSYNLVRDKEELFKVCIEIVKARVANNYIGEPDPAPYRHDPELDKVSYEEIKAMPIAAARDAAMKAKKEQEMWTKTHAEEIRLWAEAQKVLKDNDGVAAYMLLDERRDYEYERVELVEFDNMRERKRRR